jgi:class 3 adenylate cyclase
MKGASVGLGIGLFLFGLGFCPSFVYDKWSIEPTKTARRSYLVLFVAIELIVISSLTTIFHLPGSNDLAYLSIFVFTIYIVFFTRHTEGRQLKLARSRQLACVLFTDIVGFTQMMGDNEEKALKVLDKNRAIQNKAMRKYRGKQIKEMGDGTMIIFYTAYEAMQFALFVQQATKEKNKYQIRIGMHIAEVLFTDEDVFGDGVNVASRIASITKPNEICFSQGVFQNVKNRDDLQIKSLGATELKGVDYALELYSI